MFPRRKSTLIVVLVLLVVAGILGLGEYVATAADILLWLLCALLVAALVQLIWRRAAERWR
jgi:hypothetical protein